MYLTLPLIGVFVLTFILVLLVKGHRPDALQRWMPYNYLILATCFLSMGTSTSNLFTIAVGVFMLTLGVIELARRQMA